jgi:uncharacterized damage-inducible protein DinB
MNLLPTIQLLLLREAVPAIPLHTSAGTSLEMNAVDVVRRLHRHRSWVNQRLLEAVRPLPYDQLQRQFAIGQGSIWKSLTHLYAAEFVWLEALLGNEDPLTPGDVPGKLPGNQEAPGAIQSLDELIRNWQQLDQRWNEYLMQLSDVSLDDIVFKVSTSFRAGKRQGTKRVDVLLHVCTHAQYTIAQIVNMLRQLGYAPFDVMLITLARREGAANSPQGN